MGVTFRRLSAPIFVAAILLSACSNTNNSQLPSANSPATQAHSIHAMDTTDVYTSGSSRPLDSEDDDTWWANGGSGGLVSGGGSGCGTKVCPAARPLHGHGSGLRTTASIGTSSTRRAMSLGPQMVLICWYEAITPGVHDPLHDKPLGCAFEDFFGNYQDGPDQTWTGGGRDFVGIHGGKKDHDGCASSPDTIGDPIDTVNGTIVSVTDINVVISNGNVVGWMYGSSSGTRYYQPNYATHYAWNFNVSIGIVSGGVGPPGGYGPVRPWTGSLPPGSRPYKCFTDGSNLIG